MVIETNSKLNAQKCNNLPVYTFPLFHVSKIALRHPRRVFGIIFVEHAHIQNNVKPNNLKVTYQILLVV